MAIRLAIGASRRRIVRQMLSESLLIAAIGATAGRLVARWFSGSLVAFLSSNDSPLFVDLTLDWRGFAFTVAVAVSACVLFGLAIEIGVRMALGADGGSVVRMIVGEAGRLLIGGLVFGVVLAVFAARSAAALL